MAKSKLNIDLAINMAISHTIAELNKKKKLKNFVAVFAIKNSKSVSMIELDGVVPEPDIISKIVGEGLEKLKAKFVVFTVATPQDEEHRVITAVTFDKDYNKDTRISPYKIEDGKIVPVKKLEKGFHVFLEDDKEEM